MSDPTSIVLVDDHTVMRNGLKSLIEVLGNYKVTAQFDNGREFIEALPFETEPDLVIMDLNMPELSGLETVRLLQKNGSKLKILVLTLETDERNIIELFRLGVRGYLPKNCSAEVLKNAIDSAVNTGFYHSEMLQQALVSGSAWRDANESKELNVSDREQIFLNLVCNKEEYTYDQIANLMNVSRRTVDGYRESLFTKFDLKSKTGLVMFAIKHNLVKIE
jgi:two-component system invasion response regulator UvrY